MDPAEYAAMDEAEGRMWWYRALHARLLDAVRGTRGPVLDAGCGTGGFLALLRADAPDCVGVEWSEVGAARAARKSGAPTARGSVNALPFPDASFGAVVSADVLCHAAVMPGLALAEMTRVLRPGGRLVVNMPAYAWLRSAHDRHVHNARRVTARTLREWLGRAGLVRVRARHWNGLLLPLMVVQRKLLNRDAAASDVAVFPPWLDATFHAIATLERRSRLPLPFGGSVLAVGTRP